MNKKFSPNPRKPNDPPYTRTRPYSKPGFKPRKKLSPMPIGEKCTSLCPLFRCTRGALVIINRSYRGRLIKEPHCRLTGEKCVGFECKYASCRINALLPDGRCSKALEKKMKSMSDEELFKEMQEIEDYDAEDFAHSSRI